MIFLTKLSNYICYLLVYGVRVYFGSLVLYPGNLLNSLIRFRSFWYILWYFLYSDNIIFALTFSLLLFTVFLNIEFLVYFFSFSTWMLSYYFSNFIIMDVSCSSYCFPSCMWGFLSCHFQDVLAVFGFEQFDSVCRCELLCVSPTSLLNFRKSELFSSNMEGF